MDFIEAIDYLNRNLSAGKVIAKGRHIRPVSHPDHPGRIIQGARFVYGSNQIDFMLKVFDGQVLDEEQLDSLVIPNLENYILHWEG